MKELINKFKEIERETSSEKGNYNLFALFLREDSPNRWDILVSADWIDGDKDQALKYIAQKIQSSLSPNELLLVSRIVIIEEDNPALPAFLGTIGVKHGNIEIKDSSFNGLEIKHGFLITSINRRQEAKFANS